MYKNKNFFALIPARGGSKGLPNKNLKKIGGRSLVEWALFTAKQCDFIDHIIVSSDSKTIIDKANQHGSYAPFQRPSELAEDNVPTLPVIQHALKWIEENENFEPHFIILLEPTAPFRLPMHIKTAVDLAISKKDTTSVVSLLKIGDSHPVRVKKLFSDASVHPFCIDEPEGLRRQDQEDAFIRNTATCIFNSSTIKKNQLWGSHPYGFEMDSELYGINIDDKFDLFSARYLYDILKRKGLLHLIDAKSENI